MLRKMSSMERISANCKSSHDFNNANISESFYPIRRNNESFLTQCSQRSEACMHRSSNESLFLIELQKQLAEILTRTRLLIIASTKNMSHKFAKEQNKKKLISSYIEKLIRIFIG